MTDRIEKIIRECFGIDTNLYGVHTEQIFKEHDPEKFSVISELYRKNLASHPNREKVSKQLYVGDDIIVHLYTYFPKDEVSSIKEESVFYYPICSIEEILRIEQPKTASDYLLKYRADPIAANPRIARIFLSRKLKYAGLWSLTSYYTDHQFHDYVNRLSQAHAEVCNGVAAGFAFLREPNGACIKTKGGKIIVVSEGLRHFLYYMNVFLFSENFEIPSDDASSALFIGIKTMLQTETPDFDLDPRGELPQHIQRACWDMVDDQIKFVIGHEYAHLLLDHFGANALTSTESETLPVAANVEPPVYYTPRQQQEFEADAGSLLHADYTDEERARIINAATLFFLHLDLFYVVSNYINPSFGRIKTHPNPIERIWALRKTVLAKTPVTSETLYSDSDINDWLKYTKMIKDVLIEKILPYNIDGLESYSSIYLPSYCKKFKHDRFDF